MKKILIILFLVIFSVSGAGLVFGNFINLEVHTKFVDSSGKNLISESKDLHTLITIFESNIDISNSRIESTCNIESQFILQKNNQYYFRLSLLDDTCKNPNFVLKRGEEILIGSNFTLNIQTKSDIYGLIIDYPNTQINDVKKVIDTEILKYSGYKSLNETTEQDYLSLLKKQKIYQELIYKRDIINIILDKRSHKYSIPVKGYEISDGLNVIPNADRSYRKDYTDGIHHGWDIMAPLGTPVSAIDDGIIIRVVSDFEYEDLSKIKKGNSLTHSEKLRNLDILRGRQVWLKTMKGDVIFYSHLDSVYENITEGMLIEEGTDIGTIGVSGVPDRNYKNFHLHFPIQKNPHDVKKAGKYSLEDIMNWDWYLKGLDATDVINGKDDIFKSHENHDH